MTFRLRSGSGASTLSPQSGSHALHLRLEPRLSTKATGSAAGKTQMRGRRLQRRAPAVGLSTNARMPRSDGESSGTHTKDTRHEAPWPTRGGAEPALEGDPGTDGACSVLRALRSPEHGHQPGRHVFRHLHIREMLTAGLASRAISTGCPPFSGLQTLGPGCTGAEGDSVFPLYPPEPSKKGVGMGWRWP